MKGATLKEIRVDCEKEMRGGCKRLFLLSDTGWEDTAVRFPAWKKYSYLDEDLQFVLQMISTCPL